MVMFFRTTLVLGIVLILCGVLLPVNTPVVAQSGPQIVVETLLPNSYRSKHPQVATFGDQVYITAIAELTSSSPGKARLWSKAETVGVFPSPFQLGTISISGTDINYVNAAIATAPDGAVLTLWFDNAARRVYFRRRDSAGNWGPIFTVTTSVVFPVRPSLTVVRGGPQAGRIIAVWRDDSAPGASNEGIYYTFSDNNGASWASVTRAFSMKPYLAPTHLATDENGEVILTFTRDEPRPLHIMVARWMGSGFSTPIDVNVGSGEQFADSSVTIFDGRVYVGYRHTEDGIFYAEKPINNLFDNQPWPRARLSGGKGDGRVTVEADQFGNLHFAWIRTPAAGRNQNRLGYAARLNDGTFLGPIESAPNGPLFNAWGASSAATGFFLHVAHEQFDGGQPSIRYALFRVPGSPFGSPPLIEGGASRVGGDGRTTVIVTFPGLGNKPQDVRVRWRWGAPPTDTESDSGGWVPLAPNATSTTPLTVPIPIAFLNANDCSPRELFTQLRRNGSNPIIESTARSAAISIDTTVVAEVDVVNPLLYDISSWYPSNYQIRDLDPGSTPLTQVMLSVVDSGDCSGISRVKVADSSASLAVVSDLPVDGRLQAIIPLPGVTFSPPAADGVYPVVLRVFDRLGNSRIITRTIRLDRTPPQLTLSGSEVITTTDSPAGDILQDLHFDLSGATLTEANGILGMLIAVSPTAVTNPASATGLRWISYPINVHTGQFTVQSWSLAESGVSLSTSSTEQTFYIYIRLIDRAGNIGDTILSTTATSTLTRARTFLPIVEK
ncbi:MAG: exo-alpha-sialidase [Chloroflexus sp.]